MLMSPSPPDDLNEVVGMALVDLEYPDDFINETAEFILVMRRQNIEGKDEVIAYASDDMSAVTGLGMLTIAKTQMLEDLTYDSYDD